MGYRTQERYESWVMSYVGKIPANRLGKSKKPVGREGVWYGLSKYGLGGVDCTVHCESCTRALPLLHQRLSPDTT